MELPHIGKHCSFPSCNQLDFLPFVCDACKETFCLNHKSKENHCCSVWERSGDSTDQEERPEYQGVHSYPCSIQGCSKRELAPISCHHCGGTFCLDHRVQEDHCCPKLPEKKPEETKTSQHVQRILAAKQVKVRRPPSNPKAIQLAAKVNLMKMKAKAVGDAGIPQNERVYFKVIPPLDSGKTSLPLFFSKVWSVGRIVDVIADRLCLPNDNNTQSHQKLRLFHGDTGSLLAPDMPIGDFLSDSNSMLHTGGCVILERVSDDVNVLDGLEQYS